ncbi:hypothetical protein [Evansella clarkii]|uniref:hypothetical protein n=1 Tax=Evansella clarkii TaxID=79879 RepID=UPI000998DCB9|nr:hypothetical protein [Evansella clarkii]
MKRILIFIIVTMLLTGCSLESIGAAAEEDTHKDDNSIYIEVFNQDIGHTITMRVLYNTQTGCLTEVADTRSYNAGASLQPMLDPTSIPICGISEHKAREMFDPS